MKRLCFKLSWGVLLAAVSSWGADGPAASGDRPVKMTSVVHSDQRTGKLVRSMVVTSKPVAERTVAETVVASRVVSPAPPPSAAPVMSATAAAPVSPSASINEIVAQIAARESLPPQLIHSVIKVESNYDARAVSPKGALGLMQLIPSTAQRFGVTDVFNPADNIQGGARYLRYLLELFSGDYPLALAAYNAGEGAVAKYGGVPPYAETRNYLVQISKQLEKSMVGQPQPKPAETKPEPKPNAGESDGESHLLEVVQPDGTVRYVSKR